MSFDYEDPYVTIDCTIAKVTPKAVQIEDEAGDKHWIPRSCLHGGHDRLVEENLGDAMHLYIRKWIAEREGLI